MNALLLSALCHLIFLVALAVYPDDARATAADPLRPVIIVLNSPVGRLMAEPPSPEVKRRPAVRRRRAPRVGERSLLAPVVAGDLARGVGRHAARGDVRDKLRSLFADGDRRVTLAGPGDSWAGEAVRFIRSIDPHAALALGPSLRGGDPGGAAGTFGDRLRTIGVGPIATGTRRERLAVDASLGGHHDDAGIELAEVQRGDPLPQSVIARVVANNREQVRYCYEKRLHRIHDLEGRVLVHWVIGPDGNVVRVDIASTTLQNAWVEGACGLASRPGAFPGLPVVASSR